MDSVIRSALTKPGNLTFSSNLVLSRDLESAGSRVVREPTGHLIVYGPHGRRVLATDPDGNPLHECEWVATAGGGVRLARARLRLDWGQWVGLRPEGMVQTTQLDLSAKPGWAQLKAEDLRHMAARAMQVPLEEVRFFYGDEDLVVDAKGVATIRQRKDAFYVLADGTFEPTGTTLSPRVRFMACLGAMHWSRINFLPVVELFQSLLPGTGSATFELIRGLYDDQNSGKPLPLRYRGIPAYPSEAAFRLFSSFFMPQVRGGGDPIRMFLDASRCHEVSWLPAPDPPRRYFDLPRKLCVTVQGRTIQKATVADDPSGLPFVNPGPGGFAPCDRSLGIERGMLVLRDGDKRTETFLSPTWGPIQDTPVNPRPSQPFRWRGLFAGAAPGLSPDQAFAAVLLYPEDDAEIDEGPTQPFVADYLQDAMGQDGELKAHLDRSGQILVYNFDTALSACVHLDRPRDYTILYQHTEFAQKHAQMLWNHLARAQHLEWAKRIRLLPADVREPTLSGNRYDLVYWWVPFSRFIGSGDASVGLTEAAAAVAAALKPDGRAFIVGPEALKGPLQAQGLRVLTVEPVALLPTFLMHRTILPRARVRAGLTLFIVAAADRGSPSARGRGASRP
jgi:hypothetical protein